MEIKMNIDEIRSNAPDGATHFRAGRYLTVYYKTGESGKLMYSGFHSTMWRYTENTLDNKNIKPL